jgi:nucleoside diphosphate kinase
MSQQQVAAAIITPHTIRKSRTGAVVSRLLGRLSSELIAAHMFAPTREFAEAYAASLQPAANADEEKYRKLIRDYILENLVPSADGRRHRAMMLVFRGPQAQRELAQVVGRLSISGTTGETIRDAYGDLVWAADGSLRYFEPAVLTMEDGKTSHGDLRLWLDFARQQPVVLRGVCTYGAPADVQQTLVLIKPDSWREPSLRPGAILDMFSRTGLRIIGCKLCRMSVRQALEFYGPVESVLCRKLAPGAGARARSLIEEQMRFKLPDAAEGVLVDAVGMPYARDQFERIIEFMSGTRPSQCPADALDRPGKVKCLALVYEGESAVQKIRDVLGPTNPTAAPSGTVRREFGSDVMMNTAHASDSAENAVREMGVLRIDEGDFADKVERALKECGA